MFNFKDPDKYPVILTHKVCIESAILVREKILEATGRKFLVYKEASSVPSTGCFFRYGNGMSLRDGIQDTDINTPDFCTLATCKNRFSELLLEKGFNTPAFHKHGFPSDQDFPVMLRSTLTGCYGTGITVVSNEEEFLENWKSGSVWTKFIETDYEVRAYVLDGEMIYAFYKVPFEHQKNDKYPVRSEYHYSYVDISRPSSFLFLKKQIRELGTHLNGKIYSLDVGHLPEGGYIFFEANSGSWLNDSLASRYANYLIDHFSITSV